LALDGLAVVGIILYFRNLIMVSNLSAKEIWQIAKESLQVQMNKANYETWLKDTMGIGYNNNQFIINVPNAFTAEWLEKRLRSLIAKTLIGILGHQVEVLFQVSPKESIVNPQPSTVSRSVRLNPRYTFDTFIVGNCNRLAHAASLGVAEEPAYSYNPLFLYGGVGLGKTHLIQAIGHTAVTKSFQVIYVSSEQFTNEFINAIKERKTEQFNSKYRSADFLLIDDIQFISGKEQTQEAFFHTFNELHNNNHQIVLTSDRPPRSLALLEERLRSRFEWGLTADIQPPDFETRLAILRAKDEQQSTWVSGEILEFIAQRYQRNIRELEGALNRVTAFARLIREPMTLEIAQQALRDIGSEVPLSKPTPEAILKLVSDYFNLSLEVLKGNRRDQPIALARQIAMYLIREETSSPLDEIGKLLGGRDHSTILHGYQKIAHEIDSDAKLRHEVIEIREQLYSPR
jgi:chromosomal replication initiator protein